MKTIIVGAGLSGIFLSKKIDNSIVLEKSNGIGGRLASRRLDGISFDHGAREFKNPWGEETIHTPHQWIKKEAESIECIKNFEVQSLSFSEEGITVLGTKGEIQECDKLILTSPAPQAKAILNRSNLESSFLEEVQYSSKIQFLILANGLHPFQELDQYFDLKKTTITQDKHFFLFEMKPEKIDSFIEMDKQEIKELFLGKLDIAQIIDSHVHKWRYSEVIKSISPEFQNFHEAKSVFLAGDYFGDEGVKSAYESVQNLLLKLNGSL